MGNCTERYSPEEKHKHYCKETNKNDKKFIYISANPDEFPDSTTYINHLKITLSSLKKQEKRLKILLDSFTSSKTSTERLIAEVQKGQNLTQTSCLFRKQVLIRVSLHPQGPYFDTSLIDFELPTWNECTEFLEPISKYEKITFTVYQFRPTKNLKALGECSVLISSLSNQNVSFDWLTLKNSKIPDSKLLVRLQWVNNEHELYEKVLKECENTIEKIQQKLIKIRS